MVTKNLINIDVRKNVQAYRERLCGRGSIEKNVRLVSGTMVAGIQSSAHGLGNDCPDGVTERSESSSDSGPGAIPGRDTDNMTRDCAGSRDNFRRCWTTFDS